jgi:hypothetical protein
MPQMGWDDDDVTMARIDFSRRNVSANQVNAAVPAWHENGRRRGAIHRCRRDTALRGFLDFEVGYGAQQFTAMAKQDTNLL